MAHENEFLYPPEALDYLAGVDPKLGEAIKIIGPLHEKAEPSVFHFLVHAIIGQQISMAAQDTIMDRMLDICGGIISPESIAGVTVEQLQSCGTTFKKVEYIRGAAFQILAGDLDLESLYNLPDSQVIEKLSALKGIGPWTAEMVLIFSLNRMDVVSYGDLAILRGMRMLYHHRKITPALFNKYKRRYSPYGSVASFYLWKISLGAVPGMKDYAPLTDAKKKAQRREATKRRKN